MYALANTVAEIFFFGAPYKAEKSAIAGVKALNTKFIQVFQRKATCVIKFLMAIRLPFAIYPWLL